MFDLHQTNRRRLFRILFVLLCALPTTLLIIWGCWRRLPTERWALQRDLSKQTGLQVTCDSFHRPRPGMLRIDGLELCEQETGQPVGQIHHLVAVHRNNHWQVTLPSAELSLPQLAHLLNSLHGSLLCQTDSPQQSISIACDELFLQSETSEHLLVDLSGQYSQGDEGPQLALRFRPDTEENRESSGAPPILMRWQRNRQLAKPATRWEIDTGNTPLPCWLVETAFPWNGSAGQTATFQGQAWVQSSPVGNEGWIRGCFRQVDLDQGENNPPAQALRTIAEITLEQLHFRENRIVHAEGSAVTQSGEMSHAFLTGLAELFQQRLPALPPATEQIAFDRANATFQLDAEGLSLAVSIERQTLDSASANRTWFAGETAENRPPATSLLRLLANGEEILLPATPQAEQLLRVLPLARGTQTLPQR